MKKVNSGFSPMRLVGPGVRRQSQHMMQIQDILFSQGFGTRRVCCGLVQQGLVQVQVGPDMVVVNDPTKMVEAQRLVFEVQGVRWAYQEQAFLMLHKPAGFECSHKPGAHPSIYTLLPGPLRSRGGGAAAGVQAVGRLDHDTTGLLLLSDDGKFIHRMTSPRHHVPKVYEVRVKHPLDSSQLDRLRAGVVLDDDPKPVRAAACSAHGDFDLELTLTEGKYHQVKRMVAAVGNRVEGLHRSCIGAVSLPPDLLPGQWRWLTEGEVVALTQKASALKDSFRAET
jgi:16S rRNA pseudouridine516 synthase